MRFMTYHRYTIHRIVFIDFTKQKLRVSQGHKVIAKANLFLHFEHICQDLSCLTRADIGAGKDQVKFYTQIAQALGNLTHFFAPLVSERALAIGFIIRRCFIGSDGMANNIKIHVISPREKIDLAQGAKRYRVDSWLPYKRKWLQHG